jgi:hypothetical protein
MARETTKKRGRPPSGSSDSGGRKAVKASAQNKPKNSVRSKAQTTTAAATGKGRGNKKVSTLVLKSKGKKKAIKEVPAKGKGKQQVKGKGKVKGKNNAKKAIATVKKTRKASRGKDQEDNSEIEDETGDNTATKIPPYRNLKQNLYRYPLQRPAFNAVDDADVCNCDPNGDCGFNCQNRVVYM